MGSGVWHRWDVDWITAAVIHDPWGEGSGRAINVSGFRLEGPEEVWEYSETRRFGDKLKRLRRIRIIRIITKRETDGL